MENNVLVDSSQKKILKTCISFSDDSYAPTW